MTSLIERGRVILEWSSNPSAKFGGDWKYNGICGLYLLGIDTDMIMAAGGI